MAVKWMNGIVVLFFLIILFANKDYFTVSSEMFKTKLTHRSEMSHEFVVRSSALSESIPEVQLVESPLPTIGASVDDNEEIVYVFQIQSGMGSKQVSELMYDLGITEDETEFNNYLVELGAAKKIQIGTYRVTSKMSLEEIAYKITNG